VILIVKDAKQSLLKFSWEAKHFDSLLSWERVSPLDVMKTSSSCELKKEAIAS